MLAALQLLLVDNGDDPLSDSVLIAPALTWLIIIGGLYGSLRLVIDVVRAFRRPRPPGTPPGVPGQLWRPPGP